MTVPFVDLALQHRRIAEAVQEGFARVLEKTSFILGPEVAEFEDAFADYCGVKHVVGVGNGTDALEIALLIAGVGPGDEVILPANTFVATAEAVVRAGAQVVLVDCDENFLIDTATIADRVTERTKAIIPVHLYGQAAPVDKIYEVVGDDIVVLEDAAQAQGARRNGVRVGALGDLAATSFYPGKNLGAYGDAGAIMTDSTAAAERARSIRNHGGVAKYQHTDVGRNSRLDALQAVVLLKKLSVLDAWNEERREAARRYHLLLEAIPELILPDCAVGNEHVWHLYVAQVPARDQVLEELTRAGIGVGIHYPVPVHLTPAFGFLGYSQGDFPVAEGLAGRILSLPIFPGVSADQQEYVAATLARVVENL